MKQYSYSSASRGLRDRTLELIQLVRIASRPTSDSVEWALGLHQKTKERVLEHTGVRLESLEGLEIGPGQQLGCLRCFSLKNAMSAIDTDVILRRSDPSELVRALRANGAMRVLKTLARKALGVDARFGAELRKRCGVERFAEPRLLRMSATDMTFADATFDFVYSHSVFEHIDDPTAALREVRRVLRPGGVCYVSVHLYTCHSGSHDPKILADGTPIPPLWPHLRPELAEAVHPNTYLNRWRMAEWLKLFDTVMPGAKIVNERQDDEIGDGLEVLREAGELREYGDDELMTVNLIGIWRKPLAV